MPRVIAPQDTSDLADLHKRSGDTQQIFKQRGYLDSTNPIGNYDGTRT